MAGGMRIPMLLEISHLSRSGDLRLGEFVRGSEADIAGLEQTIITDAVALSVKLGLEIPRDAPSVDLMKTMNTAETMGALNWVLAVKENGVWDYKKDNPQFAHFAQWNYGFTAAGVGWSLNIALRLAGFYQWHPWLTDPKESMFAEGSPFDLPGKTSFYGDNPMDQYWIKKGYEAYFLIKEYFEKANQEMQWQREQQMIKEIRLNFDNSLDGSMLGPLKQ